MIIKKPKKNEDIEAKYYEQEMMCELCQKTIGYAPYYHIEYVCPDCKEKLFKEENGERTDD